MSDTSQGPGWWLASDGRWYPPTTAPGPTPPPPPPPPLVVPTTRHGLSPALTVVLQVTFLLAAALNLVLLLTVVRTHVAFEEYWSAPFESGTLLAQFLDAEERMRVVGVATTVVQVLLFVTFVLWSWRGHRATEALRPGPRRWSRGWTIGAWFVPFANLLLPKRVLNEVERIAVAPRHAGVVVGGWERSRISRIGTSWWLLFMVSWIAFRGADGMAESATRDLDADLLLDAYVVVSGSCLVATLALVLGAAHVGRIARRLSPEALAGGTGTPAA